MPRNRHGFGSAVAWMAAGNWVEQAISFGVFVALARILGAEQFGLVAMAASVVILAEFLVRETMTEWLISAHDPEPGHFDAVFWVLGAVSLLIWGLIALTAGPIAAFYDAPQIEHLIRVLAVVVPIIGFTSVPVARLRRDNRFDILGLRAVIGITAGGAVGLAMALTGGGVWSLVAFRVVQVIGNAIVAWIAARWRPGGFGNLGHVRGFLGMGMSTLWLQAAHLVCVQSATVIYGATMGPVAAGYFSLAWRVIEIVTFLVNVPLAMVSQTAFASARRQGKNVEPFMDAILRVTTLISLAIFAGLAVLAAPFVVLCFGQEWWPAVPMVRILSLVGLYKAVERIQHAFCLSAGKAKGLAVITTLEAVAGIVMMLVAAPYGTEAVAAAFAIRFILFWPLRFAYARPLGGVSLARFGEILVPGVLASLAMVAVLAWLVWGVRINPFRPLTLIGVIFTGAVVFLGFVAIFMPKRFDTARLLLRWQSGAVEEPDEA